MAEVHKDGYEVWTDIAGRMTKRAAFDTKQKALDYIEYSKKDDKQRGQRVLNYQVRMGEAHPDHYNNVNKDKPTHWYFR